MKKILYATAVLFALALAGCDQQAFLQKLVSPQDQENAKAAIDDLRSRRLDDLEKRLDPSLRNEQAHAELLRMAGFFPDAEPLSETLVGARTNANGEATLKEMTFEYAFPGNRWLLLMVTIREASGNRVVVGMRVIPKSKSLEEENAFHLAGKTPAQYGILTLCVIFPLLTVYAFVLLLTSSNIGRKWLWGLFILFGIGKLALNWTTGAWQVSPLFFQLFSASAGASLNGPWVFGVSLPLGAIVFLLRRRSIQAAFAKRAALPQDP